MREEAAQRKALKDAKAKLYDAISDVESMSNFRRQSVLRRELAEDLRKQAEEAEAEKKRLEDEDRATRAGWTSLWCFLVISTFFYSYYLIARKAAMNEKWIRGH